MSTITVCVVSSHPIVVAGIRSLLAEIRDCAQFTLVSVPGEAEVVIYDVFNLANGDHLAADLNRLIATHPGRVLALSRLLQPTLTARALAAGAVLPVSIGADGDELAALIESIATGSIATDSELAEALREECTTQLRPDVGLTAREQEVLALIAAGYSNTQIAARLYISINTVKTNIRTAYWRLRVCTRTQAVAWAIENGYATVPRRSG